MSNLETKRTSQPVRIDLVGAGKRFGDKEVLKDIELTVEKNEFVAIIGKSGSGKSTLLRLVAGLESLSDGELLFNGKPAGEDASKITMMYQDSRLLPWKTVIQNVGLGLKGTGRPGRKAYLRPLDSCPTRINGHPSFPEDRNSVSPWPVPLSMSRPSFYWMNRSVPSTPSRSLRCRTSWRQSGRVWDSLRSWSHMMYGKPSASQIGSF